MMRDHRLVRGDERLARAERVARERERRSVGAADHLDDDIDIVGGDDSVHIVFPAIGGKVDAAVFVTVARRHSGDLEGPSRAERDQFAGDRKRTSLKSSHKCGIRMTSADGRTKKTKHTTET